MSTGNSHNPHHHSRRERQIMDVLLQKGEATAIEVLEAIPNPSSYSTVRALLARLKDKGHISYRQEGPRYIFTTNAERGAAGKAALRSTVKNPH